MDWPAVCKGAAGGQCRRVRTVLGSAGMGGETSSPEKYYGLHWGIWRAEEGGVRTAEGGMRTAGGGTAKAAPRAAASAKRPPAQSRFVKSEQQPCIRGGKGRRSLYLALPRWVPGPRFRFPLKRSPPRHPLLRSSAPQFPKETPPTPQDPAGKQNPPLCQSPPAFYRLTGPLANRNN